jgi:hypothetical protein
MTWNRRLAARDPAWLEPGAGADVVFVVGAAAGDPERLRRCPFNDALSAHHNAGQEPSASCDAMTHGATLRGIGNAGGTTFVLLHTQRR